MPAYNAERFVVSAVNSIINQTFSDFEFIITDDCSTDATLILLQSIIDPRIKLFSNKRNAGVAATLNRCLGQAKGELIVVMHADDRAHSERIEKQVLFLNENPDLTAIGCNSLLISDADHVIGKFNTITNADELLFHTIFKGIPFLHPSVMYRKDPVMRIGMYNSAFDGMEDHELWLRLVANGFRLGNIPEALLAYRVHSQQVSKNFRDSDVMKSYRIYQSFLESVGISVTLQQAEKLSHLCDNRFVNLNIGEVDYLHDHLLRILSRLAIRPEVELRLKKIFYYTAVSGQSKKHFEYYRMLFRYFKYTK